METALAGLDPQALQLLQSGKALAAMSSVPSEECGECQVTELSHQLFLKQVLHLASVF